MKIRLIFFLFFGLKMFICSGQSSEVDLYQPLVDNIMVMWTKIDIVRAINIDNSQKKILLEDLINDSFDAYYLSRQFTAPLLTMHYDQDFANLVSCVRESFEEVFCSINNNDFYVFCVVLQKIVNMLKAPKNINPEIPTQNIR